MSELKVGQVCVIGISSYEKNGVRAYNLYGYEPFSDYEIENGATGYKSFSEWTNRVDLSLIKQGDIVEPRYAKGFQGKAVLENVTVIAAAKNDK